MRNIIKEKINAQISAQLFEKQKQIDNGTLKPNWTLTKRQRNEITTKLLASQKELCCYCECEIDSENSHIEHFFERHDRKNLIYNYEENMLLSCNGECERINKPENKENKYERLENISCGHKKSKTYHKGIEIDYLKLLNPTKYNEKLIDYFDGKITPDKQCNKTEKEKVNYTTKRLHLDCNRLTNKRITAIINVNNQLIDLTEEEQKKYIADLLDETQKKMPAFFSTIKSNFAFIIEEYNR